MIKKHSISRFLFIGVIVFLFANLMGKSSFGQDKLFVKAGFGIPELINAGLSYQLKQFQLGLYVGGYPDKGYNTFSTTADFAWHFGGKSRFTDRKPYYLKLGVTYIRTESDLYITKADYLTLRIGKDINLSKRLGLALDLGTSFEIFFDKNRKEPSDDWTDSGSDAIIVYGIGFGLYYKIF